MRKKIKIFANSVMMMAELNETHTAKRIWTALPISAEINIWGDEIYFSIPVKIELEEPRASVDIGDIAYWPPGQALCIFYGPTPVSRGGEIRPASPVTVVGKLLGNPKDFNKLKKKRKVTITLEKISK